MKFPQITWKTIKHTWIFCGYQNAVPNIHTKSIQFPCLVFQVLWIFQNPMINHKKFGVEKWLIFPVNLRELKFQWQNNHPYTIVIHDHNVYHRNNSDIFS